MGKTIINGKTYNGNSISIQGDRVIIDGNIVESVNKGIKIEIVHGPIDSIYSDKSLTIVGNINGNVAAGGSVSCDTVVGNITTKKSVACDDVEGDIFAGGSVNCDKVTGNVTSKKSVNRD